MLSPVIPTKEKTRGESGGEEKQGAFIYKCRVGGSAHILLTSQTTNRKWEGLAKKGNRQEDNFIVKENPSPSVSFL